ncbi:YbgC/FadM family acyl-CoA thioesterase [Alphaproteobacteria bacterium]|nr:YbgC/FadM family acyl-CoA thioesterase [Alphaproteobacteria bacterium]
MKNNFENLDGFIRKDKHIYPLRVFFEDTDAGQIVYHTNYLKYFERARSSLLNLLKINQLNLKKTDDIILVVKKVDVNWYKSARLNDMLFIETCLKYAKNSSITVIQDAYKYDTIKNKNELLVSGIVQIVAINRLNKVQRMNSVLNHKFFLNKS